MESIILASGSLRRQEYFKLLGLPFKIIPPQIDEGNPHNLRARDLSAELAMRKVEKTVQSLGGKLPLWIFAADTLIALDGKIYGKCRSRDEAEAALRSFSGREHEVFTSCALFSGKKKEYFRKTAATLVQFKELSGADIEWYLESGEWQGTAGSYRIQGLGACLVSKITGSYSNVVGLPLSDFYDMLLESGYPFRN